MEGQAELANQGPPGRLVVAQAPAKVLDIDRSDPPACRDGELVAVNNDANRHSIHFGNVAGDRLCAHRLRASQERGHHRRKHQGTTAAEDVSPVQTSFVTSNRHSVQASERDPCRFYHANYARGSALDRTRRSGHCHCENKNPAASDRLSANGTNATSCWPRERGARLLRHKAVIVRGSVDDAVSKKLERARGFEPPTPTLARLCSTPELHPRTPTENRRNTI